jgi:hypothetical protein
MVMDRELPTLPYARADLQRIDRLTIDSAPDGGVTIFIPKRRSDWEGRAGLLITLGFISIVVIVLLTASSSVSADACKAGLGVLVYAWLLIGIPVVSSLFVYYRDRYEPVIVGVSPKSLFLRRPKWFSVRTTFYRRDKVGTVELATLKDKKGHSTGKNFWVSIKLRAMGEETSICVRDEPAEPQAIVDALRKALGMDAASEGVDSASAKNR